MKAIKRDTEGYYVTLEGSVQQEGKIPETAQAPNRGAPKYRRKILVGRD